MRKVGHTEEKILIFEKMNKKSELSPKSFRDIMIQGGNAIDSVIATLLCVGVVNPQSSGIGGGFLMTFYNKFVSNLY